MLTKIWFLAVIMFVAGSSLLSQTMPCDINYKDGKGIYRTRMIGIHQDLLLVSDTGSYKIVNVEKISRIRFDNGTYLWTGVGIGAVAGFVSGIVYYEIFSKKKKTVAKDAAIGISLVFTLPAAIIGGIVGLVFRNIDDYDLSNMHPYVKSKEIKYIMRDHSTWK
jgi:hypothetical protein